MKGDINKFNEYIDQIRMVSSEIESINFDFSDRNYQTDNEILINISGFNKLEKLSIFWG